MIIYELACEHAHRFEGWFKSADSFDDQASQGMVQCPVCGSARVQRLPSAHIGTAAAREPAPATPSGTGAPPPGDARVLLRALTRLVLDHTEDVGQGFAEEARRIHYAEAPERAIRGQATPEEVASLEDEGIEVLPLPILGKDDLNS